MKKLNMIIVIAFILIFLSACSKNEIIKLNNEIEILKIEKNQIIKEREEINEKLKTLSVSKTQEIENLKVMLEEIIDEKIEANENYDKLNDFKNKLLNNANLEDAMGFSISPDGEKIVLYSLKYSNNYLIQIYNFTDGVLHSHTIKGGYYSEYTSLYNLNWINNDQFLFAYDLGKNVYIFDVLSGEIIESIRAGSIIRLQGNSTLYTQKKEINNEDSLSLVLNGTIIKKNIEDVFYSEKSNKIYIIELVNDKLYMSYGIIDEKNKKFDYFITEMPSELLNYKEFNFKFDENDNIYYNSEYFKGGELKYILNENTNKFDKVREMYNEVEELNITEFDLVEVIEILKEKKIEYEVSPDKTKIWYIDHQKYKHGVISLTTKEVYSKIFNVFYYSCEARWLNEDIIELKGSLKHGVIRITIDVNSMEIIE